MLYDPFMVLGRRELLRVLGAGALVTQRAGAAGSGLNFTALDHVGITVSDTQKSAAFYARVFGNTVYKYNQTAQRLLKLGPCYISLRSPEQPPRSHRTAPGSGEPVTGRRAFDYDHLCLGMEAFDASAVKQYLAAQGVDLENSADFGRSVTDPDGNHIQFWNENSWSLSIHAASPESYPAMGDPIFRPTGLDHVLLDVTDPEKSAAFYEKLFGPVTQRNNRRIWFQTGKSRIGLLSVASGGHPGLNHFCVSAAAFEFEAVMKRLEQVGAKVESPEVAGAPQFRDPDGILVQIMGPRATGSK